MSKTQIIALIIILLYMGATVLIGLIASKKKEEYIQKAYSGLKAIGQNPIITYYNFCTNGSHYAGEAKIHTIGYGPSKENLAHVIDEYVEVEQIEKVTEGYYAILEAYLRK